MIVQAAKIIGSGLATIGLTNTLLLILTNNKDLLLSDIIYTDIIRKAISTVEKMILSLPNNNLLLKFLNEEIPKLTLKNNKVVTNNNIEVKYFINLNLKNRDEEIENILKINFLTAGIYVFIALDDE
jgi:hypothetical protein